MNAVALAIKVRPRSQRQKLKQTPWETDAEYADKRVDDQEKGRMVAVPGELPNTGYALEVHGSNETRPYPGASRDRAVTASIGIEIMRHPERHRMPIEPGEPAGIQPGAGEGIAGPPSRTAGVGAGAVCQGAVLESGVAILGLERP